MKKIILNLILLCCFLNAMAQNEVLVSPVINPPYSPYLSDYEEEAIILLQNNTSRNLQIKLSGRLTGDNGFEAFTKPEFQPLSAIELRPLESRTIFAASESRGFLDRANIETNLNGRVEQNIIATGILPEGNYLFCIQALDFQSGEALSQEAPFGCIPISISFPQPPQIIQPHCETFVQQEYPTISWTPPVGNIAGADIRYDLYVLKLLEGQNPFDAMNLAVDFNGGNPLIIQDLSSSFYNYLPSDPVLENGAKYALQVIARDANENLFFENEGRSEVCTFTFSDSVRTAADEGGGLNVSVFSPPSNLINNNLPYAEVRGRMMYKYPYNYRVSTESTPTIGPVFSTLIDNAPDEETVLQTNMNVTPQIPLHPEIDYSQPYWFSRPVDEVGAKPLTNVPLRLVVRYVMKGASIDGKFHSFVPISDPGYNPDGIADIYPNGKVLATTHTDANGNYTFVFPHIDSLIKLDQLGNQILDFEINGSATAGGQEDISIKPHIITHTGIYRVLRVEVASAYYASPDLDILIQPNQTVTLPDQVSLVKAYNMRVTTKADNYPHQVVTPLSPLPQMIVEVHRKNNPAPPVDLPTDDGQQLNEFYTEFGGGRILSRGESNAKGQVIFPRLVKHRAIPYLDNYKIRVQSKETNTNYAYHDQWRWVPSWDFPISGTLSGPPEGPYTRPPASFFPLYNHEVKVKTYDVELFLKPKNPEIFGEVRHGIASLPGVSCELIQHGNVIASDYTDQNGYFRLENLPVGNGYQVRFSKSGYVTKYIPQSSFALKKGQFYFMDQIQLEPMGKVIGYVVNEQNEPLMASVKIADGPWEETNWININALPSMHNVNAGNIIPVVSQISAFLYDAPAGTALPLVIDPHSDQYFRDTFFVDVTSSADIQPLGVFTLKERLHRIKFVVVDENQQPISGATVGVEDSTKTTVKGIATFAFASPGSHFLVSVHPPAGSNLVPFQQPMLLPISKDFVTIKIELKKGFSIDGLVTAGPDSLPLAGARVFIRNNSIFEYDLPLVEAYTDADGRYQLEGLPQEFLFTANGQPVPIPVEVVAVKQDPFIAYVGDEKMITLPHRQDLNLHLDIVEGLNFSTIWGFPVEVESYEAQGQTGAKISGAFVDLPANGNFKLKNPNFRLPFIDLFVEQSTQTDASGNAYLEPSGNEILLGATAIPIDIFDHYQGSMKKARQEAILSNDQLLMREVSTGQGVLEGNVYLELASFQFSYNYSGAFYLGETADDATVTTFKPETVAYPRRDFNIFRLNHSGMPVDIGFSIHEFPATANRNTSYISGDSVRLNTILHTNIALANPADLNIDAGFITVLPTDILSFSGGDELDFKLEAWTVNSESNWFYDKNNGGIHIYQATIKAGPVHVPVKNMILRYDDISIGEINLNNDSHPFSLAGVTKLNLLNVTPQIYYDGNFINDFQPHWIIEVLGDPGQAVASTTLPHFSPSKLYFNSFKLISNATQDVNLMENQSATIHQVLDFDVLSIITGSNYFELSGTPDLNLPNMMQTSALIRFTKENNQVHMDLQALQIAINGAGKVKFDAYTGANDQVLSAGLFRARGQFTIKDESGNSFNLEGQLSRTPQSARIDIIKVNNANQKIVCGGQGGNYLEVFEGNMIANLAQQKWNFMEFDARPVSTKGMGSHTKIMHFTVYGAIEASDEAITVDEISTPFGGLELVFDIADMSLSGHLLIDFPISVGAVTMMSGQVNFRMSDHGFYFLFGGDALVPVVGTIGVCVLVGHHDTVTPAMQTTLAEYAHNGQFPAAFNDGFSGFLINGRWEPVNESASVTIPIVPGLADITVAAYAQLGIEVRIAADFGEDYFMFSALGYGNAGVYFGLDVVLCTIGFGVEVGLELLAKAEIHGDQVSFEGCASVSMGVIFDACIDTACWNGSISMNFEMNSASGIDAGISLDNCTSSGDELSLVKGSGADAVCD